MAGPINVNALARRLIDEWNATEQPIEQRGLPLPQMTFPGLHETSPLNAARAVSAGPQMVDNGLSLLNSALPVGRYEDGSYHLAMPGLLSAGLEGYENLLNFSKSATENPWLLMDDDAMREASRSSFDAAGLASTGGLVSGAVPKGALASNAMRTLEREPIAANALSGRNVSPLGFYSKLDEVLGSFKPTDRVTAQTLQQRGVKAAEIEARGLKSALDKGAVPVSELQSTARANPVDVRESVYGGDPIGASNRLLANADQARRLEAGPLSWMRRGRVETLRAENSVLADEILRSARWKPYSLDPSNPTYRETVLRLPVQQDVSFEKYLARYRDQLPNALQDEAHIRSGHWSEPNAIAHARTSMVQTPEGRPVFHIDELQSDWGQKLRDGGVRDEAKIASIRKQLNEQADARDAWLMGEPLSWLRQTFKHYPEKTNPGEVEGALRNVAGGRAITLGEPNVAPEYMEIASGFRLDPRHDDTAIRRRSAELYTAETATPGHPLVNTTDQWVNTALRRMIRQAVDADAEYMAIPSGDTVIGFGMGGKADGLRYAYDQMYPKNLRNILAKIDPEAARIEMAERLMRDGNEVKRSRGHTLFPLTDTVRQGVLNDGLPLFSNPRTAPMGLNADDESDDDFLASLLSRYGVHY